MASISESDRRFELLLNQKPCNIDVKKLWDAPGTAFKLLQELTSVYKKLEPLQIASREEYDRISYVLALLQMASHPEVRMGFIRAKIPYYVYPILQTTADDKALAHLRLQSMSVLCALVKCDDPGQAKSAVHFLLDTEVFPWCLHWIDKGTECIQEISTLIVVKILKQELGLRYCCDHAERVLAVIQVLTRLLDRLATNPCDNIARMLNHVVNCFLRLSEARSNMVNELVRSRFPARLTDDTFLEIFQRSPEIFRGLQLLLCNLTSGFEPNP